MKNKILISTLVLFTSLTLTACSEAQEIRTKALEDSKEVTEIQNKLVEEKENIENQVKETVDNVSREYKSALGKAQDYANSVILSKEGIRNQLVEFEKFPQDAADYAVKHLDVNWKENALKKAENYSNAFNMSSEAIYNQLIDCDKFTKEEAKYAVDHLK